MVNENYKKNKMQFKYLADLKTELKKFTGFMTSDVISEPASKSVALLSDPNLCLPIEDSSSPIVSAFSAILHNRKSMKSWPPLIATMCSCISTEVITGDALQTIVETMESVSNEIDYDSGLRIIQFVTSSVGNRFLEIPIFKSLLSLVSAFCSSKDKSLYTAAVAAVRQILNSFIQFSMSSADSLSPVNKREIDECFSMTCETTISFDNPTYRIIYLILRDLSRMCNGDNPVWVRNHNISINTAFFLLESIISVHSDLLKSSPHFLQLIEVSMIAAEKQDAILSFSVTAMDNFLESMQERCANHFNSYLSKLNKRLPNWIRSLQFFRIFLFKRSNIIFRFYKNCDPEAKLLYKLIQIMVEFCDVLVNQDNIELSLSPMGYDQPNEMFVYSAPIEIAIYFVQACLNSDPSIKDLVSVIWKDILIVISVSMTSVVDHSCYILMQNLHLLVELSYSLQLEEARGAIISSFCTVLMSQHSEIRKNAFNTLTYAVQSSPADFTGHWYKILSTLAEFQWEPTSLDFTSHDIDSLEEITSSLLSVHNGGKIARSWSLSLFSDIIIFNIDKFEELWPKLTDKFIPIFEDGMYDSAVSCLSKIILKGFNSKSELMLCQFMNQVIETSPQSRKNILEIYKTLLAAQGQIINKGWNYVIKTLSPLNYIALVESDKGKESEIEVSRDSLFDSSESIEQVEENSLISLGFQCLQVICSDLMFTLDDTIQSSIIKLLFEYTSQRSDTNVSLSAFNQLWNVIPLVKTSSMWKLIFSSCVPLINDDRNDVSMCAVKTFFSIIMTNAQSLPQDVFSYLSKTCFGQIIDLYESSSEEHGRDATHQLFFQEIAHCARSLWDKLETSELWPRLVEQHSRFMKGCEKRDAMISSFQFYEEAFQCFELARDVKLQLFDTLDQLASFLLEKEPAKSSLFGAFGRLFLVTIPTQRGHLDDELLQRWLDVIKSLIIGIDCGQVLPPTTHKSLDALLMLLPLPQNQVEMIYNLFVDLAVNEKQNKRLTEVAVQHCVELFTSNDIDKDCHCRLFVLSGRLFTLQEADKLLLLFVEKDFPIADGMVEDFAHTMTDLGARNAALAERSGQSVLKVFTRLSDKMKMEFVTAHAHSFTLMSDMWRAYLVPGSEKFECETAVLCTKSVARSIGQGLANCPSDKELEEHLSFLRDIESLPDAFHEGKSGPCWHLNSLYPMFVDLVLHPSEEIRKILREIFLKVNIE